MRRLIIMAMSAGVVAGGFVVANSADAGTCATVWSVGRVEISKTQCVGSPGPTCHTEGGGLEGTQEVFVKLCT